MNTLEKYTKNLKPNEICQSLTSWAQSYLSQDSTDTFISELCFVERTRRADLVLANGSLSAFEIKSEKDSLLRWQGQQLDYLTCFEKVWLCVHTKHIKSALLQTHDDVGLLVIDNLSNISMIRQAKDNYNVKAYNLTGFLWRTDLDQLAKQNEIKIKSKMRIKEVRNIITNELPIKDIKVFTLKTLKTRYSSLSSSSSIPNVAGGIVK